MSKPQIALKLKVNNILENSIQFTGDDIEFSARLFSNISGDYVWENSWKCKRENTSFIRHKLMTELCNYFDIELPAKLQDDLSRSKRNTEDLIARYQRDMGKYQMDLLHRKKKEKVPSTRDIELQEKLADLKKQPVT